MKNNGSIPKSGKLPSFKVIGLAASAGGLNALGVIMAALPSSFPAAIVIVQHLDPRHRSMIADILNRHSALEVREAKQGDCLAPGLAYTAPPGHHLLVNEDGSLSLTETALVNFVRPSADLLFNSIASSCDSRAVAVVLSGTGIDGSSGLDAIHKAGGKVIAQDEDSSEYFGMPGAAIKTGNVDLILPLADIPQALQEIARGGTT